MDHTKMKDIGRRNNHCEFDDGFALITWLSPKAVMVDGDADFAEEEPGIAGRHPLVSVRHPAPIQDSARNDLSRCNQQGETGLAKRCWRTQMRTSDEAHGTEHPGYHTDFVIILYQ